MRSNIPRDWKYRFYLGALSIVCKRMRDNLVETFNEDKLMEYAKRACSLLTQRIHQNKETAFEKAFRKALENSPFTSTELILRCEELSEDKLKQIVSMINKHIKFIASRDLTPEVFRKIEEEISFIGDVSLVFAHFFLLALGEIVSKNEKVKKC